MLEGIRPLTLWWKHLFFFLNNFGFNPKWFQVSNSIKKKKKGNKKPHNCLPEENPTAELSEDPPNEHENSFPFWLCAVNSKHEPNMICSYEELVAFLERHKSDELQWDYTKRTDWLLKYFCALLEGSQIPPVNSPGLYQLLFLTCLIFKPRLDHRVILDRFCQVNVVGHHLWEGPNRFYSQSNSIPQILLELK